MIVKTRYRDIPWKEVDESHRPYLREPEIERWNREYRGRVIEVITEPLVPNWTAKCLGPVFRLANDPTSIICAHLAEIGD